VTSDEEEPTIVPVTRQEIKMAELKTKVTAVKPKDFIAALENETRRKDAQTLVKLFEKITGWKAKMWGPTIVGFGAYRYTYETGHAGSMCVVGFSPRKANLVIYAANSSDTKGQLKKLGKHKGGDQQCLYINKLADVDLTVLEKIIRSGLAEIKKRWPVTPS
jgi:hypothetical protein